MSDRKIKIKIDPLGNPTVEAEGFTGGECAEATRGIEQALGGIDGADRELKSEYYEEGDEGEENTIRTGW